VTMPGLLAFEIPAVMALDGERANATASVAAMSEIWDSSRKEDRRMARCIAMLRLTREGAMGIEAIRAVYEETKIFFDQAGYKLIDLYATLGEFDFVSIVEVPDQDAIGHLFRRAILAAASGNFEVKTMPAIPMEEFLKIVDEIRPPEKAEA
jgi:uncharacterized protein with GYD domain